MLTVFCLLATMHASALEPSVRAWLRAESHLASADLDAAVAALSDASEGPAAPLAALQGAMLGWAARDGSPEADDAFVAAVQQLPGISYDELWALAAAEPLLQGGFSRMVVDESIMASTLASLTQQAACLLEARGDAVQARALRERIRATWPDSVDGRYLRRQHLEQQGDQDRAHGYAEAAGEQ
jgi:hypothetical protein